MATIPTDHHIAANLILKDTLAGLKQPKNVSEHVIAQTAGLQEKTPVMDGILKDTLQGIGHKETSELSKAKGPKPKTVPRRMGQVPYAGPKY